MENSTGEKVKIVTNEHELEKKRRELIIKVSNRENDPKISKLKTVTTIATIQTQKLKWLKTRMEIKNKGRKKPI